MTATLFSDSYGHDAECDERLLTGRKLSCQ